jgi:hypothetical protein
MPEGRNCGVRSPDSPSLAGHADRSTQVDSIAELENCLFQPLSIDFGGDRYFDGFCA